MDSFLSHDDQFDVEFTMKDWKRRKWEEEEQQQQQQYQQVGTNNNGYSLGKAHIVQCMEPISKQKYIFHIFWYPIHTECISPPEQNRLISLFSI